MVFMDSWSLLGVRGSARGISRTLTQKLREEEYRVGVCCAGLAGRLPPEVRFERSLGHGRSSDPRDQAPGDLSKTKGPGGLTTACWTHADISFCLPPHELVKSSDVSN